MSFIRSLIRKTKGSQITGLLTLAGCNRCVPRSAGLETWFKLDWLPLAPSGIVFILLKPEALCTRFSLFRTTKSLQHVTIGFTIDYCCLSIIILKKGTQWFTRSLPVNEAVTWQAPLVSGNDTGKIALGWGLYFDLKRVQRWCGLRKPKLKPRSFPVSSKRRVDLQALENCCCSGYDTFTYWSRRIVGSEVVATLTCIPISAIKEAIGCRKRWGGVNGCEKDSVWADEIEF